MLDNFSSYLSKQGGKFVLSSISLLNKIIKSDIDIIKQLIYYIKMEAYQRP